MNAVPTLEKAWNTIAPDPTDEIVDSLRPVRAAASS